MCKEIVMSLDAARNVCCGGVYAMATLGKYGFGLTTAVLGTVSGNMVYRGHIENLSPWTATPQDWHTKAHSRENLPLIATFTVLSASMFYIMHRIQKAAGDAMVARPHQN